MLKGTDIFWNSWPEKRPFAWAILPDHFHAMLNVGESSLSDIIHSFKIRYSRKFRDLYGPGRVWQNRFWDHAIRDQKDFNRHVDYIHINPVKHGLVKSPRYYQESSFNRYFESRHYDINWRGQDTSEIKGTFGE
ncbi:MAG: transposase [candidate division Zixibacteria bacterium]|nr:transposase [candidate division Zixibacteria bacterium]